ncbi:hypothetical protein [Oscillatoria sp. HE19RPO]|nr:hypothetical protein [Oscillatoria sp. HE19RPO]
MNELFSIVGWAMPTDMKVGIAHPTPRANLVCDRPLTAPLTESG